MFSMDIFLFFILLKLQRRRAARKPRLSLFELCSQVYTHAFNVCCCVYDNGKRIFNIYNTFYVYIYLFVYKRHNAACATGFRYAIIIQWRKHDQQKTFWRHRECFFYNEVRSVRNIIQFTITYIYVHHITYINIYPCILYIWTTYFSGAKFC